MKQILRMKKRLASSENNEGGRIGDITFRSMHGRTDTGQEPANATFEDTPSLSKQDQQQQQHTRPRVNRSKDDSDGALLSDTQQSSLPHPTKSFFHLREDSHLPEEAASIVAHRVGTPSTRSSSTTVVVLRSQQGISKIGNAVQNVKSSLIPPRKSFAAPAQERVVGTVESTELPNPSVNSPSVEKEHYPGGQQAQQPMLQGGGFNDNNAHQPKQVPQRHTLSASSSIPPPSNSISSSLSTSSSTSAFSSPATQPQLSSTPAFSSPITRNQPGAAESVEDIVPARRRQHPSTTTNEIPVIQRRVGGSSVIGGVGAKRFPGAQPASAVVARLQAKTESAWHLLRNKNAASNRRNSNSVRSLRKDGENDAVSVPLKDRDLVAIQQQKKLGFGPTIATSVVSKKVKDTAASVGSAAVVPKSAAVSDASSDPTWAQLPPEASSAVKKDPTETAAGESLSEEAVDVPLGVPLATESPRVPSPLPLPPTTLSRDVKSLPEALDIWAHAIVDLIQSKEMAHLADSTCHLACSATHLAVQTALFFPVTVPVCAVRGTTSIVVGTTTNCISLLTTGKLYRDQQEQSEPQESPVEGGGCYLGGLVGKVWGLPGFACGVAGQVTQDLGGKVVRTVVPGWGMKEPSKEPDSEKQLNRLRLDYDVPEQEETRQASSTVDPSNTEALKTSGPTLSGTPSREVSKYLLRVCDLGMTIDGPNGSGQLGFLDLDADHREEGLFAEVLNRMFVCGLSLLNNHPTVRVNHFQRGEINHSLPAVTWKVEGSTSNILRSLAKMPVQERLRTMQRETLIWSGKFDSDEAYAHNAPFFLARGLIQRSPREFLHLLWDNERTSEYNNFCLGRSTVLDIDDNVLQGGANTGTKVIKSETRVPFTPMSVHVSCLMHVRPLPKSTTTTLSSVDHGGGGGSCDDGSDGYVIISRTLDTGTAGSHVVDISFKAKNKSGENGDKKSEIVWGINILRPVANHPDITDLTSLSQVRSGLVPKFMAKRIGIMGIEDFFKNVRGEK